MKPQNILMKPQNILMKPQNILMKPQNILMKVFSWLNHACYSTPKHYLNIFIKQYINNMAQKLLLIFPLFLFKLKIFI